MTNLEDQEVDTNEANEEATGAETERKSIIDPKYAAMKGASDWVGRVMEAVALTTGIDAKPAVEAVVDADGNETTPAKAATKGKSVWNLDKLFALANENHIATDKYESMKDTPSGIGRARMTISNMLRARAKKRHGLFINGKWTAPDEDFVVNDVISELPDGSKVAKVKPAAEPAEAKDDVENEDA